MENEIIKKISGEDRGFKFNVKTFEIFSEITSVEFGDMGTHFINKPFKSILAMVMAGNEVYSKGNGADEYVVADWIDELTDEAFQEIWNCFEVNLTKYLTKMTRPEDKKKS